MSIAEIDWQSKLSPDSDLPPDVFFLVQAENGEDNKKKIGAQKLPLAGVSPVFKNMFYSPMKEEGEVVVKETTPEAFDAMIKYIYHPIGGEPFNRQLPERTFWASELFNQEPDFYFGCNDLWCPGESLAYQGNHDIHYSQPWYYCSQKVLWILFQPGHPADDEVCQVPSRHHQRRLRCSCSCQGDWGELPRG